MKQTAVDWLVNVVQSCIAPDYIPKEIIEQAKEMEKQHIIDAWIEATPRNIPKYEAITKDFAEQYYNETYGK